MASVLQQALLTFVTYARILGCCRQFGRRPHLCSSGTAHMGVTNCCGRIKISDITICAEASKSMSSKEGSVSAKCVSRLALFRGGAKIMTSKASLPGSTT